jgi:nitroreductase
MITPIKARFSTRAFLSKAVSHDKVNAILDIARWAPSGKNMQPWYVAAVSGKTQQQITQALLQTWRNGESVRLDYQYHKNISSQCRERAFACGMALYGALHINRTDKELRQQQWESNYHFFGAPVGLFIFLDRDSSGLGTWMEVGMFIQNIMLAALEFGLATCPQISLAEYPDIIRRILGSPYTDKLLVCGIALGYPDTAHPVNQYRTTREEVVGFTHWYD